MIPEFNKDGVLPAGIHLTNLIEFKERFVYNYKREAIYNGFLKLVEDLKKMGSPALYVDGSFITKKQLPNDVDVCWERIPGDDFLRFVKLNFPIFFKFHHPRKEQQDTYCADVFPADFIELSSGKLFLDYFQIDRNTGLPKGIIKIEII
jgi:hypothetical protein